MVNMKNNLRLYKLSKDYEKLFELIKEGFRVAGWVWNKRMNCFGVVEIMFDEPSQRYFIGSRGQSYTGYDEDVRACFMGVCNSFDLEYVVPEKPCDWKLDIDGIYQTGCGNSFFFDSGDIEENKQKFCGYCGSPIKEVEQ